MSGALCKGDCGELAKEAREKQAIHGDYVAWVRGGAKEIGREDGKEDWRTCIIKHIWDPSSTRDRRMRREALKYTLIDDELYQRTTNGLLLKCLGVEQAQIEIG
jgi:hypothetical protein